MDDIIIAVFNGLTIVIFNLRYQLLHGIVECHICAEPDGEGPVFHIIAYHCGDVVRGEQLMYPVAVVGHDYRPVLIYPLLETIGNLQYSLVEHEGVSEFVALILTENVFLTAIALQSPTNLSGSQVWMGQVNFSKVL